MDISANGGTTWTNIRTYTSNQGALQGLPGVNVNLDLTPWAGQANLKLRWRYYSTASSPGWYAQVDEVKIKCSAPPPTAVSLASLTRRRIRRYPCPPACRWLRCPQLPAWRWVRRTCCGGSGRGRWRVESGETDNRENGSLLDTSTSSTSCLA